MGRKIFKPQKFALVTVTSSYIYCVHGVYPDIREAMLYKKSVPEADIVQIYQLESSSVLEDLSCSVDDRYALIAVQEDKSMIVFGSLTNHDHAQILCRSLSSTHPRTRVIEIGRRYVIPSVRVPSWVPRHLSSESSLFPVRTREIDSAQSSDLDSFESISGNLPSLSFLTTNSLFIRDIIPSEILRP